jgi:hypothetical protein
MGFGGPLTAGLLAHQNSAIIYCQRNIIRVNIIRLSIPWDAHRVYILVWHPVYFIRVTFLPSRVSAGEEISL